MYIDTLNSPAQAAASQAVQVSTQRPVAQTETDSTVRTDSTDGNSTQTSSAAKQTAQSTQTSAQSSDAATVTIASSDDTQAADARTPEERAKAEQEKIKDAVEKMKAQLPNSEVKFGIHEETNRVTIKILDKDTGEVVKEVPPEKTLDAIAKCMELAGMFMDETL